MPDTAKYVTYAGKYNIDMCHIFNVAEEHSDILKLIPESKILGAGFVSIKSNNGKIKICCYGKSMSLNVVSRGEHDEIIVAQTLYPFQREREEYIDSPKNASQENDFLKELVESNEKINEKDREDGLTF